MPQDPHLYGQRPAKKQKKEIPLSSSLNFASQLSSLISAPSTGSESFSSVPLASAGRARPSKNKDDIFSARVKRKAPRADDDIEVADSNKKISLKDPHGTEDEKNELARTRRKMEEKARLYAAMKRGDYIVKEGEGMPLVDFDRKWAESHPEDDKGNHSSSGSDNDDDGGGGDDELVEYKDEYGRTRQGTRGDVERQKRREKRRLLGAEELDRMSARPKAPERIIYGDEIQTAAFNPEDSTWNAMEELAAKRDRTPTPPPDTHYDGNWEIRDKGVGFYHFSQDGETRRQEMAGLERERENTERVRTEREGEKERRRREIEERRRKIEERRAEKSRKMADSFLDGLAGEFEAAAVAAGSAGETKPDLAAVTESSEEPSGKKG